MRLIATVKIIGFHMMKCIICTCTSTGKDIIIMFSEKDLLELGEIILDTAQSEDLTLGWNDVLALDTSKKALFQFVQFRVFEGYRVVVIATGH